jgi:spore germination protein GerM
MNRRHPILTALAFAVLTVAVAACGPTGALGTVPPVPRTPTPSVDPGPPDMTPEPSDAPTPSATPSSSPSGSPAETPKPTPTPTNASGDTIVIRAYYVLDGDPGVEGLVPTLREVPETTAVARAAMETLLRGEILADYDRLATAIPAGTRLLGLSIKDGVATVDLSREFESGGGSASAFRRLGQVVYTLTQFSTVRSVLFQVEGRTVTTFGSEGIVLEGPQARDDFVDILPSIFVDRPAYGAAAGNPSRVTGNANVFEATFRVAILDGAGRTLADQQATATCGTGCRGTFDVTVRYDVTRAQWGTLRTYFGSANDGSPTDVRDYPVWLTPAD